MNEPKFSIIIPVHNAEDRLNRILDSIKSQVFTDYEVICVCDACEDNSAEIIRSYGFVADEQAYHNDGLSRSRGLDLAKGEWVLFLDDDDWWMHEYVLTLLDQRLKPEIDILCFSFIFKGVCYAHPLANNGAMWPAVWNKCWKRSFIGETRFPNVYPDSDARFWAFMLEKNPHIALWDMPFYYYNYMREGSISESIGRSTQTAKDYWEV